MKVFIADSIAKEGMEEFATYPGLAFVVKTGLAPEKLKAEIGDSVGLVVRSATQATRRSSPRAPR